MANDLLERRVVGQARFPFMSLVFAIVGAVLLSAAAVQGDVRFAFISMLPLGFAACCFLLGGLKRSGFAVELTDKGLVLHEGPLAPLEIPFEQIETLTMKASTQRPDENRLKAGPIAVMHKHGVLEIPASLNVPSTDLYRFLYSKISGSGSRSVHPELATFLEEQEEKFGRERVWTFAARSHLGPNYSHRRIRALLVWCFLTGLIWVVAGGMFLKELIILQGFGVALLVVGAVGWLVAKAVERQNVYGSKHWRKASLIVSPGGIAMIQGETRGHLRWDELTDVRFTARGQSFQVSSNSDTAPLTLHVPGALIPVADIYDRPVPLIHDVIQRYWRGESSNGLKMLI